MAFAALGDLKRAWELFAMINPVTHSLSPEDVSVYRVEPFVVAADVYAVPPHTGRGGWTWYTGSAGWMYRLITESLLGLRSDGVSLRFEPLIPPDWKSFKIHYRHHSTHYHITLHRGKLTTQRVLLDGIEQTDGSVRLIDDHIDHLVDVECPPFHPMITKVDPDLPPRTASPRS